MTTNSAATNNCHATLSKRASANILVHWKQYASIEIIGGAHAVGHGAFCYIVNS